MKKFIPVVLVGLLLLVAIFAFISQKKNVTHENKNLDEVGEITTDPLDTVSSFYNEWLDALLSTTSDPYQLGLDKDDRLTDEVKTQIADAKQNTEDTLDPVLCQYNYPTRIGSKLSFNQDGKAQFLILPRGIGIVPERAVVDLEHRNGGWKIAKIECVSGESAPDREFAFEKQGFLLKNDQPPLDANTWYIVFEENGLDGHFAPLSFAADSMCYDNEGTESVCDESRFVNASQLIVKGGMSEVGVDVKRIEFLE